MSRKQNINWELVEIDYRSGIKTLREIADEHGITHGAINKRAKRDGWVRDLTAKIKAKSDFLVSKSLVSSEVSKERRILESEIVEANAISMASVDMAHRTILDELFGVTLNMLGELKNQAAQQELYTALGEMMSEGNADKLNDLYRKTVSFGGRADNLKKISDVIKSTIETQRKVHKIDSSSPEGDENKKVNLMFTFK